ncbi:glycosyl hydrolase family 17 protein [Ekhidna sp.]|uniref:glycosyl hydrolase family 17 protein n=1 Tax=Ekhidna sp. TaxID=2608089 RepID=UPI003296848C
MNQSKSASEILGNPDHQAFSFGGYRGLSRDSVPSVNQLKEGLRILSAMDIKLLRTYNTQQYAHAANLLEAIHQMKQENDGFEMYVMLGAWIDCEGAWTDYRNHEAEDLKNNQAEIDEAVRLAQKYPDIVKIIAVGNEAMVHWAEAYFVSPAIILKWVNHLQDLKKSGELAQDLWVTSSDNFASWGGGDSSYHKPELEALIKAVDYVSMHTYPYHDTHYNPHYWQVEDSDTLSEIEKVDNAMLRARDYAISQYQSTKDYIKSLGIEKEIHIGETGWASKTNELYGNEGSRASDEYKQKLYYDHIREWTNGTGLTCFYFEIFNEQWKDASNPLGSENHFGLITLKGEAKYALWDLVDQGVFEGITRNGYAITKTFDGNKDALMETVVPPRSLQLSEN